ncbi:tripartite tricarboxylate transporter TctB family protein [Massilia niastensis]|uniref:tripartite tricarboxylate transporter TctB family protein n=1 Tax=Massilia niastensis TaxID=544911 RepID=UPI0003702F7A|nr:tripartite tricarboxylate transporter TctB family protein [Massilia niastensis]
MKIRNQKDFWAGILFVVFGGEFAGIGSSYAYGTAERMGPGYFPTIVGVLLVAIGIGVALGALAASAELDKVKKFSWSTLLLILGPVVLFGVLLEPLGLVACLFLLVCIASHASHEFGWKAALGNAAVLIAISLTVFIYLLDLQFPLWPAVFNV